MQLMCENSGTPRQWMATVALWATACAASAASPAYTLVEVETGALRAGCPVLNDAANLAFAFRDTSSDSQPADGVAFWSEASGVFGQARFVSGEVLTGLIGLSGKGSAVASMAAGPDFTGVASIRPDGQILTRPPGMSGPIRVTPLAATERGAVLVDGVIDGSDGAFLVRPSGKVVRQAVPYLAQASDVNDTGAAIGGSWVDSEDRFASFWRSPRGEIQPLKGLPGTGSHDQTRAASL
ncbi:MAG TPA: hypothetical protein VLA16_16785, partial [Ideonella sp.]|nr:hypothetical protein [Ideonella sp.]